MAIAVVLVGIATSVVIALSASNYMDLTSRQYWALIATQGGTFQWPPLFAYVLALHGILVWMSDAHGESAFVAYTSFGSRARTAMVRSGFLAVTAATMSVMVLAVSLGTTCLLFDPPSARGQLSMIAVKAVWMVVCGVTFANLGAAMCVGFRSAVIASALLVTVPWLIEPLLVQLLELVPALQPMNRVAAYLPFKVTADTLGRGGGGGGTMSQARLDPHAAALVALALSALAVAFVQWRYCRTDGTN